MNAYDFDDTIYDGQCTIDFFIDYIKKNPKLMKLLPSILKTVVLYKRQKIVIEEFEEKYSELIKEYFTKNDVDLSDYVIDFWDQRMDKIKGFYKEIQQHNDLIITASPYFLMEEICQRLGINFLIASDFDSNTGEIRRACFREEKLVLFNEQYPDQEIDSFYTDSLNDKFLFPISKKVFLVDGEAVKRIK